MCRAPETHGVHASEAEPMKIVMGSRLPRSRGVSGGGDPARSFHGLALARSSLWSGYRHAVSAVLFRSIAHCSLLIALSVVLLGFSVTVRRRMGSADRCRNAC